jgi:hypothetical protein
VHSRDGVTQDESRIRGLSSVPRPVTADALSSWLGSLGWMRQHLPDFARVVAPLQELRTAASQIAGSTKARDLKRVNLHDTGLWQPVHDAAWDATVRLLREAIALAYPRPDTHALAVFSDASDTGWATLLCQYPREQHGRPITERDLQPLSVHSGTFTGSAARWSTWSKECYALVAGVTNNRNMLHGETFTCYTDHRNLLYLLSPESVNIGENSQASSRVARWVLLLSTYRFGIAHIDGDLNMFADVMSRMPAASAGGARAGWSARGCYHGGGDQVRGGCGSPAPAAGRAPAVSRGAGLGPGRGPAAS